LVENERGPIDAQGLPPSGAQELNRLSSQPALVQE
jgi:hypothetical protein